jgi:hypothetical protein
MKTCPAPILHWRPFVGTEWHCFVRVSRKSYESLCSCRVRLRKVDSAALMLPPVPLRCTSCERAATERYGVTFGRAASNRWENGFNANGLLNQGQVTAARIVSFLRTRGLAPSPYLVEILAEYGCRVEPGGGDAGLPG